MLVTILGLGGGGTQVAKEFHRWLQVTPKKEQVYVSDPMDETHDGWLFFESPQQQRGFEHGVAFAVLDAFVGDLQRFAADEGFPEWLIYQVAVEQGFGGNRVKAKAEIVQNQQKLVQSRTPSLRRLQFNHAANPLPDWLRETLDLSPSQLVIPCLSLVGGTGRGVFEYLRESWSRVFSQDATTIVAGVVPPLSEFQNPVYAREAVSYVKILNNMVSKDKRMSVFLTSYDLAHASYAAAGDPEKLDQMRQQRNMLQQGLYEHNSGMVTSALGDLSIMDTFRASGQLPVDAGALLGLLPLLSNCVGPLAEDSFEVSAIPKGLDPADIARHFGGHLVVPCYMEAQGAPGELEELDSDEMATYHSQGVQSANILTRLTHDALAAGSFLPLPVDFQPLKKVARQVIGLIWSREHLEEGHRTGVSQYLRHVHGVEPTVFFIDGHDPVKHFLNYSKGAESEDNVALRVWLYVVLKDDAPLRDFVKLAAG